MEARIVPLIILFGLWAIGFCMKVADHGKEREPENAWNGVINGIIFWGLILWAIL